MQKSKVIGSLTHIDEALEKMVASPFFMRYNKNQFFFNLNVGRNSHRWSFNYEEFLFLNYMVDHWSFDKTKLSKYELQDYEVAVEKLKTWAKVVKLMSTIEKFVGEIKRVQYMRKASEFPNKLYAYKFPEYEWMIVGKFHAVCEQLKDHPEWLEKFKNEVEPLIKQLADLAPYPLANMKINAFYGINLHSYFR